MWKLIVDSFLDDVEDYGLFAAVCSRLVTVFLILYMIKALFKL